MWAKKPTLPSKRINIANGRPDQYLRRKEPKKIRLRKKDFDNSTHFVTLEGRIASNSMGKSGIFHSTGFKHPSTVPSTPRGFNSPSEHFDIWTDEYGNVLKTRTGTPTYNGGDTDDAEHKGLGSSVTHTGKQFIDQGQGRQDRESRSPTANKKKKYYQEDYQEKEEKKNFDEQKEIWKSKSRTCSSCGGSGTAFNFSNAVKTSTGRVGLRTGYGKCRRCGGSGNK